ncbi:ABC transporter ATP-binding protein [Pseudofrankia sp. DC12]|uniref:ABC transporter ATP-binding protein n=1 Tax=Pseudofrankia sp. DC12 TaxID=683315 RepID=UPI0005F79A36|nr:ABC transporter ATP-binding protein [Pseudofrankia sp. DC12]
MTTTDPETATEPILVITDLKRSFGRGERARPALCGVSLTVAPGEWVAVVGPSGCGKSTLLHLVGGLDTPNAGSIRIGGDEVTTLSAGQRALLRRRKIGFVFQSYNLIPHLNVAANVELGLRVAGAGRRAARARAAEVLDAVGLGDLAHALPSTLSGGQQQRVAIARAVAGRPDLVLADEPTGALDTAASRRVVELLREEHRRGQTLIMVTHDYAVAAAADRVIFLRDGQIIDERRPAGRRAGVAALAGPHDTADADGTDAEIDADEAAFRATPGELDADDGAGGARSALGGNDLNDLLGLGSW